MGKRQEQKAATVAKLLGVARALFAARGFEAVGVREVARGAGMSTGAVFAHWKGKEELWEAAMHRAAPSRKRLAAFLDNVQATGAGLPIGEEAHRLARDLYGEGAA